MQKFTLFLIAQVMAGLVSAATLILPDGGTFEGETEDGLMHGEGQITRPDGSYYFGHFRKGLKHGEGTELFRDGRIFRGLYQDGLVQNGVLYLPDGRVYEGEFAKQRFQGKGKLTFMNNSVYEGHFVAGNMQGTGTLTREDGTVFQGSFNKGALNSGTVRYEDGRQYTGQLQDWQPHGEGRMEPVEGEPLVGEFAYGEYLGEDGKFDFEERWALEAERLEQALFSQNALIEEQLDRLKDQSPNQVDVYTVLAALSNAQTVFRSEIEIIDNKLTALPAFDGRLVTLANELQDDDNYPIATETSLRHLVKTLGQRLGQEDLIMMYLTSHGSREHELSVDFNGYQTLPGIDPEELSSILDEAPQNKVVIISACYSGGFIPALRRDDTAVITAAAEDRRSFGCSNDLDMTYFGQAFFKTAFTLEEPLEAVFDSAQATIAERENAAEQEASNPQFTASDKVLSAWEEWRAQASGRAN